MAALDFLKDWVAKIIKVNPKDMGISILSAYGRRYLDKPGGIYDQIAETAAFQKLKEQGDVQKYVMEFINNSLAAFLDQKIGEETPLRKLFKEIFEDTSSELNKRMINGGSVKELLLENASHITDPEEKTLFGFLIQLEEEQLKTLVKELLALDFPRRMEIVHELHKLSPEEMVKVAGLAPETRQTFFDLTQKPAPEEKEPGVMERVKTDVEKGLNFFAEEMARRKNARKGEQHD